MTAQQYEDPAAGTAFKGGFTIPPNGSGTQVPPQPNTPPTIGLVKDIADTRARGAQPSAGSRQDIPGADFMSNEDIRAFCEFVRRAARNRATERAMDADHLEAVLRTIPDVGGSLAGARARARRVSKWMKKVAAAEKAIQKYAASVYATFEREYESELRKIGRGRTQQTRRAPFTWQR